MARACHWLAGSSRATLIQHALQAGAQAYVLKSMPPKELLEVIA